MIIRNEQPQYCQYFKNRRFFAINAHKTAKNERTQALILYQYLRSLMAAPDRLELTTLRLTAECSTCWAKGQYFGFLQSQVFNGCSNNLSSRAVSSKVLSALVSLTSVFGMRTGGTSPLTSPQWYIYKLSLEHIVSSCIHLVYTFLNLSSISLHSRFTTA